MLPQVALALLLLQASSPAPAAQRTDSGPGCVLDGRVETSPDALPPVPVYADPRLPTLFTWSNPDGVLPSRNTTLNVRLRVDERGRVSSGCILEPIDPALARRLLAAIVGVWSYSPARLSGSDVPVEVTQSVEIVRAAPWKPRASTESDSRTEASGRRMSLLPRIQSSTDAGWLREIASSYEGARKAAAGSRIGAPRLCRTAAFARLGELDTDASRRAADEIERAAAAGIPADDHFSATTWQHPALHFGDANVAILARVQSPDGVTYGVVPGDLFGTWELFLVRTRTPIDRTSWSRPRPIPGTLNRGINNPSLIWRGDGRLEFTYEQERAAPKGIMEFRPEGERQAASLGPKTWPISVLEVLRDSDGDGWTDLEEERLGTDAHSKDTDRDGLDDGRDACPNNPVSWRDDVPEDHVIIRKALFATYGLSGSRMMLLAEAPSTPVHVRGYRGPVIYGRQRKLPEPGSLGGFGGVFVTWEIVNRTATEAVVILSDWEGNLAGGGQNVYLRKQHGRWYVIGHMTTWVS